MFINQYFTVLDITQQQATITKTDVSKKTNQYVNPKINQDKINIINLPSVHTLIITVKLLIFLNISKQLHHRGIPILVDEAHGAHLVYMDFQNPQ